MTEPTQAPLDKATWGDGPWQTEPDRLEWAHVALPCLAVRSNTTGVWCGYAAVPPGHPLHGQSYQDVDVDVHGGLTYADACAGHICHVPKPGEPDDVWWFGFDCRHAFDFAPAIAASLRTYRGSRLPFKESYDHAAALAAEGPFQERYRTLAYVQAETNRLAEQLAARGGA